MSNVKTTREDLSFHSLCGLQLEEGAPDFFIPPRHLNEQCWTLSLSGPCQSIPTSLYCCEGLH